MYVFSFFREFAPALHLAISEDLLHWRELNRQEPIAESTVGVKYWRDPFIIAAQDGTFHLLCTDGWSSPNIIHASSHNLVDWGPQTVIPVMKDFPSAQNAWAPEACYDFRRKEYRIFWSSTVLDHFPNRPQSEKEYHNHRIFSCTTKDFSTFSKSAVYFDPGYNVIDASIAYHEGTYLMAFKDERGDNPAFPEDVARKHVLTAITKDLLKPWKITLQPISKSTYSPICANEKCTWAEGPCVIWNALTKEWWIFFEYFRNHTYGVVKSSDGKTWTNLEAQLQMPEGGKHGTIFEVHDPAVIAALKQLDLPLEE